MRRTGIRRLLFASKSIRLCAACCSEQDGVPAGYALLSFTHSNESGGLVVLIEEVYVDAAFRGKKIGTKFFAWLFEAYAKGHAFVWK